MSYIDHYESVSEQDARHHVAMMRDTLDQLRNVEEDVYRFEKQRNLLAIMGLPMVADQRELDMVTNTIRKFAYPGRSGGIA